jgi:hypothetical protein
MPRLPLAWIRRAPVSIVSIAVAMAGASTGAGCSLTTSYDDLVGPSLADDAGRAEGGALPTGGGAGDAGAAEDGGANDTGSPPTPDTGTPINPAADAAPDAPVLGFCASQSPAHLLCDDFDETPPQGWNVDTSLGSQGVDGTASTSSPSSYLFTTQTLTNGSVAQIRRFLTIGRTPKSFHLEYDLRIDQRDATAGGGAALASVEVYDASAGSAYTLDVAVHPNGSTLEENWQPSGSANTFRETSLTKTPTVGKWVRVGVDATFGVSPTATVTFDGAVVLDRVALQPSPTSGVTTVYLGVTYLKGPATSWKVRYDDVTFDMK